VPPACAPATRDAALDDLLRVHKREWRLSLRRGRAKKATVAIGGGHAAAKRKARGHRAKASAEASGTPRVRACVFRASRASRGSRGCGGSPRGAGGESGGGDGGAPSGGGSPRGWGDGGGGGDSAASNDSDDSIEDDGSDAGSAESGDGGAGGGAAGDPREEGFGTDGEVCNSQTPSRIKMLRAFLMLLLCCSKSDDKSSN